MILKLVPKTAWTVAKLIIFFSMYDVCSITSLPDSSLTSLDLFFCSTNNTASFLPILPEVAFCIALPPSISRVIFTWGKPFSSKPVLAFVTLSPLTTTALSKKAVANWLSLKPNSSFLNGDVLALASSLNSRFAVFPIIFLAAVGSWTPGNSTTILLAPCLWTTGSETPSSLTLLRRVIKFCPTA